MASLLEDLVKPISDGSFCGEDGSYESDFETARAEADKMSGNNFALMGESSRRFLTQKSKDMRVLGYHTLASAMTGGLDSMAQTVQAYCKLATEHWEDIHPKRATARANALKWLNGERTLTLLSSVSGSGDYESLKAASDALEAFQKFCDQKFPDGPPSFGGFAKVVRDLAEKNKPREAAPEPEPGAAPAAGAAQEPAPGKITSADDGFIAIQNAAYFLQEENRANPLPYRLVRILKWEPVRASLPNENGRTLVPAPYAATLEAFRNLFQQRQWQDLASNGEEAFSADGMIFWLDLQRYLCSALIGLGGEFPACAKAIMGELALLLHRVPDLTALEFDDGTPFADAMTREWIDKDVKAAFGSGGGGGSAPIKKKGDVGEEQKQAENLMTDGKLEQALHVLRTGLANDSSEKNNFDRKLIMAELCYKGNRPNIARSLLEDLLRAIEQYSLLRWDSELCLSVYHLSQKVFLGLADAAEEGLKPAFREKALEMHSQVSKLDPVLAINSDIK